MKHIAIFAAVLLTTFAGGVAAGATYVAFTTSVSPGLVEALDSVGRNLFGDLAWGASLAQPPDPIEPVPATVQIDIAMPSDLEQPPDPIVPIVPRIINFDVYAPEFQPPDPIQPPDPCMIAVQIRIDENGRVTASSDIAVLSSNHDSLYGLFESAGVGMDPIVGTPSCAPELAHTVPGD